MQGQEVRCMARGKHMKENKVQRSLCPKGLERGTQTNPIYTCSQQQHPQLPKGGNNPRVHQWMDGHTDYGAAIQWNVVWP